MNKRRHRLLLATIAALAVLGGALLWGFHTHADGSPRGADDCVICQIAVGLGVGLTVLAVALAITLTLLARLTLGTEQMAVQSLRLTRLARGPPLPA